MGSKPSSHYKAFQKEVSIERHLPKKIIKLLSVYNNMACRMPTQKTMVLSQWVKKVNSYSSQYNSDSWSANQVIGQPKVYPGYGDKHGAWASGSIDANQYVEVEFDKAVYVTGVDIYETYHAGGTKRILAKDEYGQWRPLWETDAIRVIKNSRIFSPTLKDINCDFRTRQLRVEVDCTAAGTWVEIDAIQLHGREFYTDPPPSMDKLAADFGQLVNNSEFSDVQFLVEKQVVHGHRNILSVRSDYFKAMFGNKMKEHSSNEPIEIKDVSYDSFMAIMHYLYTNKLPDEYSCLTLTDVWRAADQFSVEGLRTLVIWTVINKIDSSNVVEVYVSATNTLPIIDELKNNCLAYMSSHMNEIVNSPQFVDLPQQTMLEIIQLTTAKLSIK